MADRSTATRDEEVAEPETFEPVEGAGTFSLTILDESKPTVDGRYFVPGVVTWRDPPIPLLFTVTNGNGHKGAQVGGAITAIRREDGKIIGEGHFASNEAGQELRQLIKEGVMTGVSADVGGAKVELEADEQGNQKQKISEGRILGVTALPLQAYDDARIAVTASAVPVEPPREWFENPHFDRPTPITVTADGRVFGHAAKWGTCHVGYRNECLTAPHSSSGYAHFTIGSVLCDDGSMVATGPITLGTGHADLSLDATASREHYDNSGTAVADVVAGEDQFGIWVAGAVRPGTPPERIREFRGSTLSGDWRPIGHNLELVGLLAVNVPGFPIPRVTAEFANGEAVALVAAGVVADEAYEDVELAEEEEDEAEGVEEMSCGCGGKAKPRPRVTSEMVEDLARKVEMLALTLGAVPETIELSVEGESELSETSALDAFAQAFAAKRKRMQPKTGTPHWCPGCGGTAMKSRRFGKCATCGRSMIPQRTDLPKGYHGHVADPTGSYPFETDGTEEFAGRRSRPFCGFCGKSMRSIKNPEQHFQSHRDAGDKPTAKRIGMAIETIEEFRNPYAGLQPRDDHGRFAKSGGIHSLTERYAGKSEKRLSQKAKRMGELNKLAKRVHENLHGREPGKVLDKALAHHAERQASYARTHAPGSVSREEKPSAKPSLSLIVSKHTKSTGSEVEAHRHAAAAHTAVRRSAPSVQNHEASGRPTLKAVAEKHVEQGGYKMSAARRRLEEQKAAARANREHVASRSERSASYAKRLEASGVDPHKAGHDLTQDERDALQRHDMAMEGGKWPIRHEADLRHAISLARFPSQAHARPWIVSKAREMGRLDMVPAEWKGAGRKAA